MNLKKKRRTSRRLDVAWGLEVGQNRLPLLDGDCSPSGAAGEFSAG